MAPRLSLSIGPWTDPDPALPVSSFVGNVTVKMPMMDPATVTFTLPGRSIEARNVSGLATDVWLYKLGGLWQRFRVLPIPQEWDEDGNDILTITAVSYKRLVLERYLIGSPPTYTATDQGDLIADLIDLTQSRPGGDLGITVGNVTTGVLRDRNEYQEGDKYEKILGNLEGVINGPWWDIDGNLVLTVAQPESFPLRDVPAIHGENIRRLKRSPLGKFANVAGSVGSTEQTVPEWREDAAVETDPRGRWETFDASRSSTTEQSSIAEVAEGLLADSVAPPSAWTFNIEPARYFGGGSDYAPGDFVQLGIPRSAADETGVPAVNVIVQITEVSVTYSADGAVDVAVASEEVD